MSSTLNKDRQGGLILEAEPFYTAPPLPNAPTSNISWLEKCRVGDDQGESGACAVFAFASWAEVMYGREITDAECLKVYAETLAKLGRPDGSGLAFGEAFSAAKWEGWIPSDKKLLLVNSFHQLLEQPLVAGFSINGALDFVSEQGCLDHTSANSRIRGYHAMLIVGLGEIEKLEGKWVWCENSWGLSWGWNGICVMNEKLHRILSREMWAVV